MNFKSLFKFVHSFRGKFSLFWELSNLDFNQKTAGTALGILWTYLNPLLSIGIIWFVFHFGLKITSSKESMYTLLIGLMSWQFISDAITNGAGAFLEKPYLIKKIKFPFELLPLIKVVNSFRIHLPFIGLVILISIVSGSFSVVNAFFFIPFMFVIVIFLAALVLALATVVVFYRDAQNVITMTMQILFWATPIVWVIPSSPRFIAVAEFYNPMSFIVSAYRFCFLGENNNIGLGFGIFFIYTVLAAGASTKLFYKLKDQFADVL